MVRSPVAHARIAGIDTSEAAQAVDGVVAVVTGELMAQHGLAWMPTLSGDTQAVLATDKVRYQGQEVAAVIATDPYVGSRRRWSSMDVEYDDARPPSSPPSKSLEPAAAEMIRDEKEGQVGNRRLRPGKPATSEATDEPLSPRADKVVSLDHPLPAFAPVRRLRPAESLADVNSVTGQATIHLTSQAPHAHRTLFAMVAGLPEQNIRIISPDIGGGFGNKVPIYPGYVVATAASAADRPSP